MTVPSKPSDEGDESAINNVVNYIKKEVEGLRILSRRIELHQAAEISALKEVAGWFIIYYLLLFVYILGSIVISVLLTIHLTVHPV